jgi:drug/metabolite transporter (DMT)-like permease
MQRTNAGTGLVLAILSAATFGTSGTFASALLDAGWSPGAAVTVRVVVAALLLTVPAILAMRGRWGELRRGAPMVATYGLVAIAGCQLCFFNAIQRLSVGVALLLEYLGIVLVVIWLWVRHGQRPRRLTMLGAGAALAGLVLVLDITGAQRIDPIGVLWGLCAAVGLATYFVLSSAQDEPLPPIGMAWAGMTMGGITLLVLGGVGALPMHMQLTDVRFVHLTVSWLVPVVGLALVATALAYVAGIGAARRLGAKLASFIGLTEVLFAIVFAWLLLGQLPGGLQIVGGCFIIVGVAVVRLDELRGDRIATAVTAVEPAARR